LKKPKKHTPGPDNSEIKMMFSIDQFRVALRIYSQANHKKVKHCMRGGPVKRALSILIKAGESV
jgi:hypothetical protein